MRVVFLAALLFTLATFCYGADTVAPASAPTITYHVGAFISPVTSPSQKAVCDIGYANSGKNITVRFHHLDADGITRTTVVANQRDLGQYIVGDYMTCTDNGATFFTDDGFGDWSVFQTDTTPNSAQLLVAPGQLINTDYGKFRYEGYGWNLLLWNGIPSLVAGTATDTVVFQLNASATKHLVTDLTYRNPITSCASGEAIYTVDYDTQQVEKFYEGGASKFLVNLQNLGFSADGSQVQQPYALSCDSKNGNLLYTQDGNLKLLTSNSSGETGYNFGNNIAGYPVGDVRDLTLGPDGKTLYWVMTVASKSGLAGGAIFASVGGATPVLVQLPLDGMNYSLLNFNGGVIYYNSGRISKSE